MNVWRSKRNTHSNIEPIIIETCLQSRDSWEEDHFARSIDRDLDAEAMNPALYARNRRGLPQDRVHTITARARAIQKTDCEIMPLRAAELAISANYEHERVAIEGEEPYQNTQEKRSKYFGPGKRSNCFPEREIVENLSVSATGEVNLFDTRNKRAKLAA